MNVTELRDLQSLQFTLQLMTIRWNRINVAMVLFFSNLDDVFVSEVRDVLIRRVLEGPFLDGAERHDDHGSVHIAKNYVRFVSYADAEVVAHTHDRTLEARYLKIISKSSPRLPFLPF